LVRSRVPDPDGNLVPSHITSGSGIISSRDGDIAEMSVAINVATYNIRTATCGNQCQTCNGVRSLAITPNPAYVTVGSTIQLYAQETLNTGDIWNVTSGSWSSSDPSATIDNNGVLTGVTAGTPTIQLNESNLPAPAGYVCTGPNGGCPPPISAYASGQATVQTPVYFFNTSGTHVSGSCLSPNVGSFFDLLNYVADAYGDRISLAGMTPLEQAPGTIIYAPFASPATTNSTGSFDDNPVGGCFSGLPPGTQACLQSFTVTYENMANGITYPINTYTVRRDCSLGNSVTFQGNNPSYQNKVLTQGTVN
jgi:hypothetical protein